MPAGDRVHYRRRAVALARHYRDAERLSISEISRPLGRAEATGTPPLLRSATVPGQTDPGFGEKTADTGGGLRVGARLAVGAGS
jgi:hypothetical protein